MPVRWREAMQRALYGPEGFFVSGSGPADHFRTSVHAAPAFASALYRLVCRLNRALGFPARFDVVDVGAGRGELLRALAALAGPEGDHEGSPRHGGSPQAPPLARRLRLTAVELAPRPVDLPAEIAWVDAVPPGVTGLLLGTEWLDNVPLDVAVPDRDGWRYLLVDPATGAETVGDPVTGADADWLATWWPTPDGPDAGLGTPAAPTDSLGPVAPGALRAEIGRSRDGAWADAVRRIDRGLALAVDYGHLADDRPVGGTLTGYRRGRQVPPVPDGSCDVTAHLAVDSAGAAGAAVAGTAYTSLGQREALRALGADGGRPPLSLAATDPAGYLRALAAASAVAELTDPAGLGGHRWLLQPVGVDLDPLMAR
ncbi:SAM-dependent methyltransferase [Micromonospora sp. DT233]|uniref:SAM-dependent methyltransferase n=1 Tax=Micromonospora sp. DT233 TaxID=3393432 RepID=UPI003CF01A75